MRGIKYYRVNACFIKRQHARNITWPNCCCHSHLYGQVATCPYLNFFHHGNLLLHRAIAMQYPYAPRLR